MLYLKLINTTIGYYSFMSILVENNPFKEMLYKINMVMANIMAEDELNNYHFMNYNSPEHFINTGFGYCVKIDDK